MLLVLTCLLSNPIAFDNTSAFEFQLPLTAAGGIGLLLGFCACCFAYRTKRLFLDAPLEKIGRFALCLSCGLTASILVRSGLIFDAAPYDLLVGSALESAILLFAAIYWWIILFRLENEELLANASQSLFCAAIAFLALSLMPQGVSLLVLALGAPLCMTMCMIRLYANGNEIELANKSDGAIDHIDEKHGTHRNVPPIILASIGLSFFVADFIMTAFPISLFPEESPLFSAVIKRPDTSNLAQLNEPALLCCLMVLLFAIILSSIVRHGHFSLSRICPMGFLAIALGYLTFPYHFPGGFPIGIAEAGRIVIAVFAIAATHLYVQKHQLSMRGSIEAALEVMGCIVLAAIIANAFVTALYAWPGFDYLALPLRSVFSGVGIFVLVVLLLGPLPRVYSLVEMKMPEPAEGSSENTLGHVELFAQEYKLSPRETDVLKLVTMGRDVPYIEQELTLSKSTVKTHMRHIYEKCGVSSRQDLLDLIIKGR